MDWSTFWLLCLGLLVQTCSCRDCQPFQPLGMQNKQITDAQITASSYLEAALPWYGRLELDEGYGAWCPRQAVDAETYEWLQIFTGNGDSRSSSFNAFKPVLLVSKIRIVPLADSPTSICLRVEFLGCQTDGVASYSIPPGQNRGESVSFNDATYDGRIVNGRLEGGLGQLTDSVYGGESFRLNDGYEWVGWRNDTLNGPVVLIFEMDNFRNISEIRIHSNNQFSKDVRVFKRALIYKSSNGQYYSDSPITTLDYAQDSMEASRPVIIKLSNPAVARFIKIVLEFDDKWILISEVNFISTIVENDVPKQVASTAAPTTTRKTTRVAAPITTTPGGALPKTTESSTASSAGDANADTIDKTMIGIIVGACTGVLLIVIMIVVIMCVCQRRKKQETPSHQQFTVADNSFSLPYRNGMCKNYNNIPQSDSEKADNSEYDQPWQRPLPHIPYQNEQPCSVNPALQSSGYGSDGPQYACIPIDTAQDPSRYDRARPPFVTNGMTLPPFATEQHMSMRMNNTLPPTMLGVPTSKLQSDGSYDTVQPQSHSPYDASNYRSSQSVPVPNIQGTSGGSMYGTTPIFPSQQEIDLPTIPSSSLRLIEKLGAGQYGEVHLCELTDPTNGNQKIHVAVKKLQNNVNESAKSDFYREIHILNRLRDPNIVQVLGVCDPNSGQLYVVTEYMPHGDLHQFLQRHFPEGSTGGGDNSKPTLSRGCLLYMATQIASGMRYLEQLNVTHRDLATRNCLVGENYHVKISDFGMSRSLYSSQYYKVEGRVVLPIRWMAWESILLGRFTTKSDVWSFGVTLWEMFTFAREQPFSTLSDDQVIGNCMNYYHANEQEVVVLQKPPICSKEIYDLLRACWSTAESARPPFTEIHLFLQRKNLGYHQPEDQGQGHLTSRLTAC